MLDIEYGEYPDHQPNLTDDREEFYKNFTTINKKRVHVVMSHDPLDFYSLYTSVVRLGGYHRVIQTKAWKTVW